MAFIGKTLPQLFLSRPETTLRWFRHPSYAGFFYWALGTQLVLQNSVSFTIFAILLWRFFYYRIRGKISALLLMSSLILNSTS